MKKYYDILEVKQTDTLEIVKKSYYSLVKQYHTDVNQDPAALEKIKKINEAWDWVKKYHNKKTVSNSYVDYSDVDFFNFSFNENSQEFFDLESFIEVLLKEYEKYERDANKNRKT